MDALDQHDEKTVLIINDWAIKFLPEVPRVSSGLVREMWDLVAQLCCVSSHGWCAPVAGLHSHYPIMQDVLRTIKLENDQIETEQCRLLPLIINYYAIVPCDISLHRHQNLPY